MNPINNEYSKCLGSPPSPNSYSNTMHGGQNQLTSASTSRHFQPAMQLSSYGSGFFYGGEDNVGGGIDSSTSSVTMPLKSDGSLCFMEALTQHSHGHEEMGKTTAAASSEVLATHPYLQNQSQIPFMPSQEEQIEFFESPSLHDHHQYYYPSVSAVHRQGYYRHFDALSLSMNPNSSQSSEANYCSSMETKKRAHGKEELQNKQVVHRKSIDTFGQRTSQYRGVTRHRWTGRYEAHLWDNSCKKEGQTRKGRQVYLGGYDMEMKAARAYDLAALKYWGPTTHINFSPENYHQELEEMKNMTRQEYVAHLRRRSSGFSRGASIYRGVTRHHQHGRWQARIGRVAGNKDLYLGTFSTQEEAAEAYDIAAIKFRGANAVTNFETTRYNVDRIMASNTLLSGELARRTNSETINSIGNGSLSFGPINDFEASSREDQMREN